jgi:dCTP deaminase
VVLFLMPRNDAWIRVMAASGMVEPFAEHMRRQGVISSGPSSYGYDMRVADEFKMFKGGEGTVLDPKDPDPELFTDYQGDVCVIPPHSFALGRSVEYFRIPRDVLVVCFGKSTYARCGVLVNVTPLEPEWEGHVTIAITNTAPAPVRIYAGEGIAQLVFLRAVDECRTSYADRAGKYQAQGSITLSRT